MPLDPIRGVIEIEYDSSGVLAAQKGLGALAVALNDAIKRFDAAADRAGRVDESLKETGSRASKTGGELADMGKRGSASFDGLSKSAHSMSKQAGDALAGIGKAAAAGIAVAGIAIVGLGAASVKVASDFQAGMSSIKAVSGATRAEMKGIHDLALKLGAETAFSASESAAGIEELIKGGVAIEDVMSGAAKATLSLAAAGGIDVADAAMIAANAMSVFNIQGKDVAHVTDLIAGAANASSLDVGDFAQSMKAAGSVAALVGFGVDDLSTSIALLGKAGITGSDAGTSLKTMMMSLQPKTKEQIGLFRELGLITGGSPASAAGKMTDLSKAQNKVALAQEALDKRMASGKATAAQMEQAQIRLRDANAALAEGQAANAEASTQVAKAAVPATNAFFDATGKIKPMRDVVEILNKSLAKMSEEQKTATLSTMFGSDAIRAGAILAEGGAKAYDLMAGAMGNVTAEAVGAEKMNNLQGSWQALTGTMETGAIMIGEAFLPVLRDLIDGLNRMLGAVLPQLQGAAKGAADKIADLAFQFTGARDMGGLLESVMGDITDALGLSTPATDKQNERMALLGEEQATAAEKGIGFQRSLDKIRDALIKAWDKVQPFLQKLQELGKWLLDNKETVTKFATAFVGLLAIGAVLGPVLTIISALSTLVGIVSAVGAAFVAVGAMIAGTAAVALGPILIVIAAVVAALLLFKLAFENNFLGAKDIVTSVTKSLQDKIGEIKKWFTDIGKAFKDHDWGKLGKLIVDGVIGGLKTFWQASIGGVITGLIGKLPGMGGRAGAAPAPGPRPVGPKSVGATTDQAGGVGLAVFGGNRAGALKLATEAGSAVGDAAGEGVMEGLRKRFPEIGALWDELQLLLGNAPDFDAMFTRFFSTLNAGSDQLKQMGADLGAIFRLKFPSGSIIDTMLRGDVGKFGTSSDFAAFWPEFAKSGEAAAQDWFIKFVLEPTQEENKALVETATKMADLHKIATDMTLPVDARNRALHDELALYPRLIDQAKALEDARFEAAKAEIERKRSEGGGSFQDSAVLAAMSAATEAAHEAAIKRLDMQKDRLENMQEDEATHNANVAALRQAINDEIERQRELIRQAQALEEEGAESIHDQALKMLDEFENERSRLHDQWMESIADEGEAESDRHDDVLRGIQKERTARQDAFDEMERALNSAKTDLETMKLDLNIDGETKKLADLTGKFETFKALMGDLQIVESDPKKANEEERRRRTERAKLTAAQKEALRTTLGQMPAGFLSSSERRVVDLLLHGYSQNAEEVRGILDRITSVYGDQVVLQQAVVDSAQAQIDAAQTLINKEETRLKGVKDRLDAELAGLDKLQAEEDDRHATAMTRIDVLKQAEEDRWKDEQAAIGRARSAEDERHIARMKAIQAEYALQLMQLDFTDAEITQKLKEQSDRAARLTKEASDLYRKMLDSIKDTGLVIPVGISFASPGDTVGGRIGGGGAGSGGGAGAGSGIVGGKIVLPPVKRPPPIVLPIEITVPGGIGGALKPIVDAVKKKGKTDHWSFLEGWGDAIPGPQGGPNIKHGIGQGRYARKKPEGAGLGTASSSRETPQPKRSIFQPLIDGLTDVAAAVDAVNLTWGRMIDLVVETGRRIAELPPAPVPTLPVMPPSPTGGGGSGGGASTGPVVIQAAQVVLNGEVMSTGALTHQGTEVFVLTLGEQELARIQRTGIFDREQSRMTGVAGALA